MFPPRNLLDDPHADSSADDWPDADERLRRAMRLAYPYDDEDEDGKDPDDPFAPPTVITPAMAAGMGISIDRLRGTDDRTPAQRRRAEEIKALADPAEWLKRPFITQTEMSVRIALWLLRGRHTSSHVTVSFGSSELSRTQLPRFPLLWMLTRMNCRRVDGRDPRDRSADWRTRYNVPGARFALRLVTRANEAHVTTMVGRGRRLLVYAGAGSLKEPRSSAEHRTIWALIGRALARRDLGPDDIVGVAIPRTVRARQMLAELREAPRLRAAGVLFLMVDRANTVDGLVLPPVHAAGVGQMTHP